MSNQALSNADVDAVVRQLAEQLGETERQPIGTLRRVVRRLGLETAQALLQETQAIEAQGGQMLPDGSRRRTPGGVFFHLVRERASKEDRVFIFWVKPKAQAGAQAGAPQPAPAAKVALSWDDFLAILPEILAEKGTISTVKITVIGRPGRVTERGETIVVAMQNNKVPALPKGLPTPPGGATSYVVFIARKQWSKVAESLKNPEDALIVEGFPAYDAKVPGILVYATNTTTRLQQQAKRAGQSAQGS